MKREVQILVAAAAGAVAGGALVKKLWLAKYKEQKETLRLAERAQDLLRQWLALERRGGTCAEYFTSRGFHKVAVFGMNWLGRQLADSLGELAVYGVELDNPNAVHARLTVYRLGDDPLPPADCMVVCDLDWTEEKLALARREFQGQIVALSDVLEQLAKREEPQKV